MSAALPDSTVADTPAALREFAVRLARDAGNLALAGRRSLRNGATMAHDTKSSLTDPVTEFDRAAEALLVETIRRVRPHDAIIGEEGADHVGTSGLEWHLDPIDGTVNYLFDLPTWCTSVAVVDQHGPVAGAVHVPVLAEMFSAARDGGATLNGERISCSSVEDLSAALVGTGFSYLPERRALQASRVAALVTEVRDIRRFGSAALDLCMVACARLDAYYEEHLNSWDLAAGVLIAAEAGASTSDFHGGPATSESTIASAPGVHHALLAAIRAIDS
jgi:myo-inositol-1(or 4)-monophosphatase